MKKGFTLIELLVVVLIIGILSAIALPQYQKAVEKARVAEVLQNAKALREAMDVYLLEQGGFPSTQVMINQGAFALELSGGSFDSVSGYYVTDNFTYNAGCQATSCLVEAYRNNDNYAFAWSKTSLQGEWSSRCYTIETEVGRSICKSFPDFTYVDSDL